MAKANFEFDVNEDRDYIVYIANKYKICSMLDDIASYRRELYKYGDNREVYINEETKDLKKRADMKFDESLGEGYHTYLQVQDIIDKLDDILENWYSLSDELWG